MFVYRALNEYDIKLNPLENGLYNKKTIYDEIVRAFSIMNYGKSYDIKSLDEILEGIKYILVQNLDQIIKLDCIDEQRKVTSIINHSTLNDDLSDYSITFLLEILSTINTHLLNGSTIDTRWISFSSDLESCMKYYLNQKHVHNLVVVDSNINGIVDDGLFAVNLSNIDALVQNRGILFNKDFTLTSLKSRAINYAKSSKEVIYYNYIPREKIKAILGALAVDLLYNDLLNTDIFDSSLVSQQLKLGGLTHLLRNKLIASDYNRLVHFFDEAYIRNIPLKEIGESQNISHDVLIFYKKIILAFVNELGDNKYVGKIKNKIKVPEEKQLF